MRKTTAWALIKLTSMLMRFLETECRPHAHTYARAPDITALSTPPHLPLSVLRARHRPLLSHSLVQAKRFTTPLMFPTILGSHLFHLICHQKPLSDILFLWGHFKTRHLETNLLTSKDRGSNIIRRSLPLQYKKCNLTVYQNRFLCLEL